MWLIVGTSPQIAEENGVCYASYTVEEKDTMPHICLEKGEALPVKRGTEALAASAWHTVHTLASSSPKRADIRLLLAADKGDGAGSRAVYARLIQLLTAKSCPPIQGITFHYLFPDVDWHNRVLMAIEDYKNKRPTLIADAGFMYVAKMSGYADQYDLFTPDMGELAFLADEKAPHPFYTRGFLLAQDSTEHVEALLACAHAHGNVAKNLIVKGSIDSVVASGRVVARVPSKEYPVPGVPAMEAIGGTGDLVTGFVTGFLAAGMPMERANLAAVRANRELAALAQPTPATQVGELLWHIKGVNLAKQPTLKNAYTA